jgi:hypothetical protein
LKLQALQRKLEGIYRLRANSPVERFLISEEQLKSLRPEGSDTGPQVLLREDGEEALSMAVHVDEETLRHIERKRLADVGLKELLSAAEEVSHFVYLSWSAENEKRVSLLDVEIQGEIDKFLLASLARPHDRGLLTRLFSRFRYREPMSAELRRRYEEANRLARRFCRSLGVLKGSLSRLRRFYRLSPQARLILLEGL